MMFVPKFCQYCGAPLKEGCDCLKEIERAKQEFLDEYYDRPDVREGLVQQDLIDSYRFER